MLNEVGSLSDRISGVTRRGKISLSLSLSPSLHMHTQRQDHRRRQPTATQGESSHQTPILLAPWSWNSRLQNCEQIIFCCLSHLVYDILLWQHKQTERKEILLLRRPVEAKDWKQWVLLCEWPLTTILGEPSMIQWGEDLARNMRLGLPLSIASFWVSDFLTCRRGHWVNFSLGPF